jgi:hypothetical protein
MPPNAMISGFVFFGERIFFSWIFHIEVLERECKYKL